MHNAKIYGTFIAIFYQTNKIVIKKNWTICFKLLVFPVLFAFYKSLRARISGLRKIERALKAAVLSFTVQESRLQSWQDHEYTILS